MLRWRLLGISFCIQPSFWFMNALWAYLIYAYPQIEAGADLPNPLTTAFLTFALIWILCIFVAVMVHELGHVITGAIFGQPGSITLAGMGGQAVGGYDELAWWKRALVIMAGPGAGFLLVAAIVAVDGRIWNDCMDWLVNNAGGFFWENFKCEWFLIEKVLPDALRTRYPIYERSIAILFMISLFMNIMNLLPIIPMDGGMLFKEICVRVAPRGGLKFAFICSFILALALALYLLVVVLVHRKIMAQPFQLYYPFVFPEFSLFVFASLAYQCFQTYRQLSAMERHSQYSQREED